VDGYPQWQWAWDEWEPRAPSERSKTEAKAFLRTRLMTQAQSFIEHLQTEGIL